jgi:LmbE family N-acetylglucosaminyl deacetylase
MTGQPLAMLSVTDGEAADHMRADLAGLRQAELTDALKSLSALQAKRASLHIPDGRVQHFKDQLRTALRHYASKDATIIAPYELDGHPDHEAVGEVCLEFARSERLAIARYPVWTWHHTNPKDLQGTRWGLFPLGSAALRAKVEALECFESQLRPPQGAPILPRHVLLHFTRPYEAFVL